MKKMKVIFHSSFPNRDQGRASFELGHLEDTHRSLRQLETGKQYIDSPCCSTFDPNRCYMFSIKAPFQMMVLLSFTASTRQGTSFLQLLRLTPPLTQNSLKLQWTNPEGSEVEKYESHEWLNDHKIRTEPLQGFLLAHNTKKKKTPHCLSVLLNGLGAAIQAHEAIWDAGLLADTCRKHGNE